MPDGTDDQRQRQHAEETRLAREMQRVARVEHGTRLPLPEARRAVRAQAQVQSGMDEFMAQQASRAAAARASFTPAPTPEIRRTETVLQGNGSRTGGGGSAPQRPSAQLPGGGSGLVFTVFEMGSHRSYLIPATPA
jgi:hypothetical protein